MALTIDQIQNSSDHLDEITKALFVNYFRQLDIYRKNATIFSANLTQKIDAAEGTVQARMLNAIMAQIAKLGTGEVEIRGDRDGVWWNQSREREALVKDAFLVLYEDITEILSTTNDGVIPSKGLYGDYAVGNRPNYISNQGHYITCTGNPCTCKVKQLNTYRY